MFLIIKLLKTRSIINSVNRMKKLLSLRFLRFHCESKVQRKTQFISFAFYWSLPCYSEQENLSAGWKHYIPTFIYRIAVPFCVCKQLLFYFHFAFLPFDKQSLVDSLATALTFTIFILERILNGSRTVVVVANF